MGDELLDAQHKVILSYMAKIRAYFLLEKKDKDLLVLVDRLETFCKLHLWDEEKVMDEMHFPEIEDHKGSACVVHPAPRKFYGKIGRFELCEKNR